VTLTHGDMHSLRLPAAKPTRKQRFEAALRLAGLTVELWRTNHYKVSQQHLDLVWKGERTASAELNAAIDATIEKYLPSESE
jgi:hypothetical protein